MIKEGIFYKFNEFGNFYTHVILVDGWYIYMSDLYHFKFISVEEEKIHPNEDRYTELPDFYFPKVDKRRIFTNLFQYEEVM